MTGVRATLLCVCIASGLPPIAARADAGHDHSAPSASGIPGANAARVEAQSDLFEIVGVVRDGVMTLYLDRYATNDPVVGAKIDIEAGPLKGSAQANPDGTYTFRNATLAQPGQFPVMFAIVAGADSDLLAGDLVIADPAAVMARVNDDPLRGRWWWFMVASIFLAGIAIAWRSRRQRVKGIVQ